MPTLRTGPLAAALAAGACFFLLLCTAPGQAAAAEQAAFADRLEEARADIGMLEDLLDDDDAVNGEVATYLDIALKWAEELRVPAPPKTEAAAEGEGPAVSPAERRAWEKGVDEIQGDTIDLLLEALLEKDISRSGRNERSEVNQHAARLLGRTPGFVTGEKDRRRLSRRIIRSVKQLERSRHPVDAPVFEGAFVALARLGDMDSLDWMMDEYLHTRKQAEEVARLRGALRALRAFEDVPARKRHDLAEEMLRRYVAMETLAEQSTTDVAAVAAQRFWDLVRTDAIPLMQHVCGYPLYPDGSALAKMSAFATWFRAHDDPRKAPWTKPIDDTR